MKINQLGIELRRINDISNLYKDVDTALAKYNINQGEITLQLANATAAHKLQDLLTKQSYFQYWDLQQILKLCKIMITAEREQLYRTASGIEWNTMLPDYRNALIACILDDLRPALNP